MGRIRTGKAVSWLLSLAIVIGMMPITAFAQTLDDSPNSPESPVPPAAELTAQKTAKSEGDGKYTISISVPATEKNTSGKHDEVILMVDGSYSGDGNWPSMKSAITDIGKAYLDGSGNTKLTLMAFGISPNVVLEDIETVDALTAELGDLPGYLLYGRSGTNCDGSFEGIEAYLTGHANKLDHAYVIYISDGGVNINNTPQNWFNAAQNISAKYLESLYVEWVNLALYVILDGLTVPEWNTIWGTSSQSDDNTEENQAYITAVNDAVTAYEQAKAEKETADEAVTVAAASVAELETQRDQFVADTLADSEFASWDAYVSENGTPEIYQEIVDALTSATAELKNAQDTADTAATAFVNAFNALAGALMNAIQKYTVTGIGEPYDGMPLYQALTCKLVDNVLASVDSEKCSISTAEYAYIDYKNAVRVNYYDIFYIVLMCCADSNHDYFNDTRGYYALEEANTLSEQVETLYMVRYGNDWRSGWMEKVESSTFIQSDNIATLTTALAELLASINPMVGTQVSVSDYMSKWVNMDPESVVVKKAGSAIALTCQYDSETGVYTYVDSDRNTVVTVTTLADDNTAGGNDTVGNSNGTLYHIDWQVADEVRAMDGYTLTYTVTVDCNENGFQYNTNYPANGETLLIQDGEEEEIEVPTVKVVKTVEQDPENTPPTSGSNNGGSNPPPSTTIPDSNLPLTGTESSAPADELEDLPDDGTPTTAVPSEEIPDAELPEAEVPASNVPRTGDGSGLWLGLTALCACGLAALALTGRKREQA